MLSATQHSTAIENSTPATSTGEYAQLLDSFGLKYKNSDFYWQVGDITKTQGWILHLSVVLSQIKEMLVQIIPFLMEERISFKVVSNESIADDLLNGNLGLAQIGKLVSIYPETDVMALDLARNLIELTKWCKGPNVPTDICLSNVVFTRYGSFNPVIQRGANGMDEKYIYNSDRQLVKDSYAIPFQLPKGTVWPFSELTAPVPPPPPKSLNTVYKLIDILKADAKGNVFLGLYLKSLFQVKNCVVKQGFRGMSSDKAGRDIQDRLIWQNELHNELADIVPLPKIYDLLQEYGFTVLIMEYIKGDSLYDKLLELNPFSKSWLDLPLAESLLVLNYAIEITSIIAKLHEKGYVHRDIVPVNFLIDKNNRLTLIDIELAYSIRNNQPDPPFTLGTYGFMSPEQIASQPPTIFEDIYGLGATLLYLFTGLIPLKFDVKNTTTLCTNLNFFIANKFISEIIAYSLHHNPKQRPSIADISDALIKYKQELQIERRPAKTDNLQESPSNKLKGIIFSALEGLNKPPVVVINDIWYSKQITIENFTAPKNKQYAINHGFSEGLTGVLYVLARIHTSGINIDCCSTGFTKGWGFLEDNYFNRPPEISPGLYQGAAGISLALAQGIHSGLLLDNETNRDRIKCYLTIKNERIDLATGIAGQGLSVLKCKDFLENEPFHASLTEIVSKLLSRQQKKGSWLQMANNVFDIGYDDTGIIWFLLEYLSFYPNSEVQSAVMRGLKYILGNKKNMLYFYGLVATKKSYEQGDGGKGLLITLIKAYETLQDDSYRKMAETALSKYPAHIVETNFTQQNGLAGIGEIYLEAWRVFNQEEWKSRADWIANVFVHSYFMGENGSGYWIMEQNNPPTADFLIGNSGIIHFLARCLNPDKIGYRLLK